MSSYDSRIVHRLVGTREAASNSLKPGNFSLDCILLVPPTRSPSSPSILSSPLEFLNEWHGIDNAGGILSGGRVMGGEPDLDAGTEEEKMLGYARVEVPDWACPDRDDGHDVFLGGG